MKINARTLVYLSVLILFITATGTLELFKDGGARDEGVINRTAYHGILNYVTVAWAAFTVIALILAAGRKATLRGVNARIPLLLGAYTVFSAMWSTNPIASVKASLLLFLGIAVIPVYLAGRDGICEFKKLSWEFFPMILISYFMIFFVPSYGVSVGIHDGAWQGMFDHKNGLGVYASLTYCIILAYRILGGHWSAYFAAAACAMLVIGSRSYTSIGCLAVITLLHFMFRYHVFDRFVRRFYWLIFLGLFSAAVLSVFLPGFSIISERLGKGDSFSGRGYIWAFILSDFVRSPIFGHGFNSFKNIAYSGSEDGDFYSSIGFIPGSAHNGFLETAHSLGIVGLIIVFSMIFSILKNTRNSDFFAPAVYICTASVILNIFESKLVSYNIIFFVLVLTYCVAKNKKFREINN